MIGFAYFGIFNVAVLIYNNIQTGQWLTKKQNADEYEIIKLFNSENDQAARLLKKYGYTLFDSQRFLYSQLLISENPKIVNVFVDVF